MHILAMLQGPDLLVVLVIVMVLFGAKKLPELARGVGQAKREFEHASTHDTSTVVASTRSAPNGDTIVTTTIVETHPDEGP